jgi:hypothetical protein
VTAAPASKEGAAEVRAPGTVPRELDGMKLISSLLGVVTTLVGGNEVLSAMVDASR